MNRIKSMIGDAAHRHGAKKLLSAYIMPGFPRRDCTIDVLNAAEEAGADFVELGIPFSDPLADGPVIQNAAQIAIANGMTPRCILDTVKKFRDTSQLPIILMGYVNSFLNGIGEDFAAQLKDAGVDGVIIPDLSLEESVRFRSKIESAGLSLVLLIAPTSGDERIAEIDRTSTDFCYCVSVTGVTGARKNLVSDEVSAFLKRVREIVRKPFVVGFGISTLETARGIAEFADGIVVGSALLQAMSDAPDPADAARNFLKSLRVAINK